MEKLTNWTQIVFDSLAAIGKGILSALPNIVGAVFLILVGWILAKLLSFTVIKTLRLLRFDKLSNKINIGELMNKANITITPSQLVGKFVYWVIILLFFVMASDTLGLSVVSESIRDLINYLPKLFSGIVIFVIGLYIANFIKKGLISIFDSLKVFSGNIISNFAYYIILIIIGLTALDQAGVDTNIITSNVTVILGGIVLAFAVSFGQGSKDVLTNILSSFYSKSIFKPGQQIEINDMTGTIERIDRTSCIIKTNDGRIIIPVNKLLTENVKIKE